MRTCASGTVQPGATCDLCLSDLGADSLAVCACGKSRCWECVSRTEKTLWCFPADSTKLFVTDLQKMADDDKIAWLKHELDDEEAPLAQFAATFLYFFGEKICIELQKDKCLKLYRQYANVAKREDLTPEQQKKLYSMRCRIPTEELTDFERVWDADAPQRCLGCAKAIRTHRTKAGSAARRAVVVGSLQHVSRAGISWSTEVESRCARARGAGSRKNLRYAPSSSAAARRRAGRRQLCTLLGSCGAGRETKSRIRTTPPPGRSGAGCEVHHQSALLAGARCIVEARATATELERARMRLEDLSGLR